MAETLSEGHQRDKSVKTKKQIYSPTKVWGKRAVCLDFCNTFLLNLWAQSLILSDTEWKINPIFFFILVILCLKMGGYLWYETEQPLANELPITSN